MDDNMIDAEVVAAEIVRCPQCGSRNRLLKQKKRVTYRCGGCAAPLENPFAAKSIIKRRFQEIARRIPPGVLKYIVPFAIAILAMIVALRKPDTPPASTLMPKLTPTSTPGPTPAPTLNNGPSPPSQIKGINAQPSPPPQEEPASPPNSLANGTILGGFKAIGHGKFTIQNDTDRDAVVKLIDEAARHSVVAIYVTAYNSAVVDEIPEGSFVALFAQGIDWNDKARNFKRKKSFWQFDRNLNFTTKTERSGNQIIQGYPYITLELAPSIDGNMKRSKITEETYSKY